VGQTAYEIAQVPALGADAQGVGTRRRRAEAEDLLRIAEHRRSMQALRRAAVKAAGQATIIAGARSVKPSDGMPVFDDLAEVTDLAEVRERRSRLSVASSLRSS
jgi:hypothetical protein